MAFNTLQKISACFSKEYIQFSYTRYTRISIAQLMRQEEGGEKGAAQRTCGSALSEQNVPNGGAHRPDNNSRRLDIPIFAPSGDFAASELVIIFRQNEE